MNWLSRTFVSCVFLLALAGCGGQGDSVETMPASDIEEYERIRIEAEEAMVDPAAGPQ